MTHFRKPILHGGDPPNIHQGPRPEYQSESTPLMVHGILYTTAGSRRSVIALDAATAELLWTHIEIIVAIGGGAYSGELVAWTLPAGVQ